MSEHPEHAAQPSSPKPITVCAISDTHGYHSRVTVPPCDVLVHAGDWTRGRHSKPEYGGFIEWLAKQPATHKILVPGNHDFVCEHESDWCIALASALNVHLLIHEPLKITFGNRTLPVFGSPWQPWFFDWAFNVQDDDERALLWRKIPDDTELLVTHSPPRGTLDFVDRGEHVGCAPLRDRIAALSQLKLHVFGHIHEGAGVLEGQHVSWNAASVDARYRLITPEARVRVLELG